MFRPRIRCLRGQRLIAKVPPAHWITSTFVAALQRYALTAPCIFDAPINGDCFKACFEQCLAPTLRLGDIVVMDSLGSHKSAEIQAAIAARGASLRNLPAYSPDPNPNEMVFAKLKARLRWPAERSFDALWHRVGALLRDFSHEECAVCSRAAGYAPP
jgi:transposase